MAEAPPSLPCRACGCSYDLETVLDHCSRSWPNQRWLWFECPACGKGQHLEIERNRISIGGIDGAPGPCFIPDATVEAPGLSVASVAGGLLVRFRDRQWRVRSRGRG